MVIKKMLKTYCGLISCYIITFFHVPSGNSRAVKLTHSRGNLNRIINANVAISWCNYFFISSFPQKYFLQHFIFPFCSA